MNQTFATSLTQFVPRMLASGLLKSLCTIRTEVLTQDSFGALVSQVPPVYTVLHANVPCAIGIVASITVPRVGTETRTEDLTQVSKEREVILGGLYDDITTDMQALVDGVAYNILRTVRDSQGTFTELGVELVTV